jgi:hypothetical protein
MSQLMVNISPESVRFPVHKYKKRDEYNIGEYATCAKFANDVDNTQ